MSLNKPVWKLRDWIDVEKLDWSLLSLNPYAINLLEENQDKIDWYNLSANPNAIKILEQNRDKIYWPLLSKNPNAIKILEENHDKINWYNLSRNPNAIEFLKKIANKINLFSLALIINPDSSKLLQENPDKINYMKLLSKNPDEICSHFIRMIQYPNKNPNSDENEWSKSLRNPNAIKIMEQNRDKINWKLISENPSIFELDYEAMKRNNERLYEELIKEVMKPSRVFKNPDYDYLEELFGD
jgi:hypothetical protein